MEEPAQSVVHQTLLSMLQSLNAPLYQLIREHRPITVPVPAEGARETVATRVGVAAQEDEDHAPRTPPTSHVHSHFRLTRAQLLSLNSVHKKWAGGQSWIVHIPFQVAQDRQSSTASVAGTASVGKESNALAGNTPSGDNSKPENEPKEYSMLLSDDDGDRETLSSRANPRDLLDTLKAHVRFGSFANVLDSDHSAIAGRGLFSYGLVMIFVCHVQHSCDRWTRRCLYRLKDLRRRE